MAVEAKLGILRQADGSSSFTVNGYSVIAGVNGPVEVQRRDELPEEAAIEVNIRPASGVPGVRERHFESIVQKALRSIIKVDAHPRTLIQVTLQVTATPEDAYSTGRPPQAASYLSALPPLLNAAMLALLSTSIPLETSLSSTIVSILPNNEVVTNPGSHAVARAASLHVFAFTGNGKLLLVESEGSFDMKQWKEAARLASQACVGTSESETMVSEQSTTPTSNVSLGSVFRQKLEDKIAQDSKWKTAAK